MHRSPLNASALPLALALAGLSACASGPRHAPAPVPAPVAAEPAPAPDSLGEGFEIKAAPPAAPVATGLLGSAAYDLPVQANRWVEMELSFLVNQRRDVVGRWLQRADRYDEWVRDVFASYGLPRDLHHLAMVESGYQATVRSRAGAVGMWQFMPATGRGMGLRIDDMVDERMDPVRATHAAARHLRQLHRAFGGNWELAAAAYNAGGGRISRGMSRFGARDFWDLAERGDLAQETRHYVPRLYAVTIIAKDPQRFGYPAPSAAGARFAYDSVRVDIATPLAELATLGNFPLQELTDLNPHLRQQIAPAQYWVWVPAGSGRALQTAFDGSDFRRRGGFGTYTVRAGDDLAAIAFAANLTEERVRQMNLGVNFSRLGRGDRLRLPADAARALSARPAARLASSDRAASSRSESPSSERSAAAPASAVREDFTSGLVRNPPPRTGASESRRTASRDADGEGERPARATSSRRDDDGESSRSARASSARDDEDGEGSRSSRRASSSESDSDGGERASRRTASRDAGDDEDRPASRRAPSRESSRSRSEETRTASRSSSRAAEGRTHTVEGGETLWGIARRYDVSVARLREANDLGDDAAIQPGQTLRVPRASQTASASSSSESSSARSSSARRASEGRRREHTVESGETLWSIARRYDSSVEAIRGANGMRDDAHIQPGQKLVIPRATSGARD